MKLSSLRSIMVVASLTAATSALLGQTNSIQLFGPTNVRLSQSGAGYGANEVTFNSSTVQLSCSASPIVATLSSTPSVPGAVPGNVLVDNFVFLTVTAGETSNGPVNVCTGGVDEPTGFQNCFTTSYENAASAGSLTGQDPDNFASTGGVPPIDISGSLQAGAVQTTVALVDAGGFLASSSIYLNTNCTQVGVTGPADITGNPISSTNPTPAELTQTFPFDSTTNQQIQFVYNLAQAQGVPGGLSITNNTIPNVADSPIDPAVFIPVWVPGTSFATSSCLAHTGELLPSGAPACKLYTLQCAVGTGTNESGAQCPVSQQANEIFQELFDGPSFTLPDIVNANGPTFHQGVGFLMASEGWTGGQCMFDQSLPDFATLLCPQNTLVTFTGPGGYASTSTATHPNSSFITVAPVPEDLTTVTVAGQQPGGWINSDTAAVTLSSQPPTFAGVQPPPPGAANFLPAPIQSITYGISLASSLPAPGTSPVPGDVTLTNSIACPTSSSPAQPAATVFTPAQQSVPILDGDGMYLLHYFAQDCASTRELKFTQDGSGTWSTNFYTVPINVDTTAPVVATGPILSPPPSTNYGVANSYTLNQTGVTATYSCTDSLSGVVKCGTSTFPAGTLNTGNVTSPVNTSSVGTQTFTVNVTDAAGNPGTPVSVSYQVVAPPPPPVNLAVVNLAPLLVNHNGVFAYEIAAVNSGGNTATGVVVTDTLPAGLTYVNAVPTVFSCSKKGCGLSSSGTSCSYAGNTVTCTLTSLDPITWSGLEEFNIVITVRATAAAGSKIADTVSITSVDPDTRPGNNQSTATTLVTK
jgi:uncharacterized repeat protein (TIGR01451 family)